MRNFLLTTALTIAVAVSCGKLDNPRVQKFAEADFDVVLTETRQYQDFHYTYDRGTKALAISVEEQRLQELWVTDWNEVTMTLKGKDASFEGANVSSSDPGVVKVEKKDARTFTLSYVADGTSVINVWNSDLYNYSFKVFAKDVIELEYMLVTIGDREFKCKFRDYTKLEKFLENPSSLYASFKQFGYLEDTCKFSLNTIRLSSVGTTPKGKVVPKRVVYNETGLVDNHYIKDAIKENETSSFIFDLNENYPKDGKVLEIKGLCPENSSWRYIQKVQCIATNDRSQMIQPEMVARGYTGYSLYLDNEKYGIPTFMNGASESDMDFSKFQGRKAFMTRWWNATSYPYEDKMNIAMFDHFADIVICTNYGKKQPDIKQAKKVWAYIACWPEDEAFVITKETSMMIAGKDYPYKVRYAI